MSDEKYIPKEKIMPSVLRKKMEMLVTFGNDGKTIYDSNFGVDFPGGKGPGSYDFPITDFESWDK